MSGCGFVKEDMKLVILLLMVVGLVSSKPQPSVDEPAGMFQNGYPNRGPEFFEDAIAELWKKYTRDDLEAPQFYSPTYDRDIIGKNMESYFGRPIYAFQGIQFGEPPTNANGRRFRPSRASTLYEDTPGPIVANHLGFKCPQGSMVGHNPSGSEDCLYLNVYTPFLPGSNESKSLPVMQFIYGGAFTGGDSSLYLPPKLLDHDVILVTIHYRLGAFGFFNLDNVDAPGNSALYDQLLSLQWTNKYIADFGGDPNKVTVFGESAGSVSSNYMMIIPQAKDLIHGVICESGSTMDVWAVDPDPRYAAEYIATYVGCPIDDDVLMYRCVAEASMEDLLDAEGSLVGTDRHNGLMGFRGAAPAIQTYKGPTWDALITKHPREYFESGEVNPVPLLIGTNKQEGSYVLGIMYWDYLNYHGLVDDALYMHNQMTTDIMYSFGVDDTSHSLSKSFEEYYCPGVDIGTFEAASPCYVDMVGVLFLKGSGWECANLHSYYTNESTYHYSFEFMSDDSMYLWLLGAPPPGLDPGVTHSDELMYLFSMPAIMEGQQIVTFQRMTLLWTNFATYGDPTPDENPGPWQDLGIEKWQKFMPDDHHFMLMNDDFTVQTEYSDRWTITFDELQNGTTTAPPETTQPSTGGSETGSTFSDKTESTVSDKTESTVSDITESTVSDTTPATTGTGGSTIEQCSGPTQAEYDALQSDYDDLESKSESYMISMIVFVVLFVVADGCILYFYRKSK